MQCSLVNFGLTSLINSHSEEESLFLQKPAALLLLSNGKCF